MTAPSTKQQRDAALALHRAGGFEAAKRSYRAILVSNPGDGETWHYRSVLCGQTGRHQEAIACARKAIASGFGPPNVYGNLANAHFALEQFSDAADAAQQAINIAPADNALVLRMIYFLRADARDWQVREALTTLDRCGGADLETWTELGKTAIELNRADEAIEAFLKASKCAPDDQGAQLNLASAFVMTGDAHKARQHLANALAIDPNSDITAFHLSQLPSMPAHRMAYDRIVERALAGKGEKTAHLQFAAAKSLDRTGRIDEAIQFYHAGNKLVRATYRYDVEKDVRRLAALAKLTQKSEFNAIAACASAMEEPQPVFIVGMPRSGSTLLEQILSSHSSVEGAGELVWFQRLVRRALKRRQLSFPNGLLNLDSETLAGIGRKYRAILRERFAGPRFVVDKLPSNLLYVPIIRQLFPDAPVIVSYRNGLDTCWSCYERFFSGPQHFAYDLTELGKYFTATEKLIEVYKQQYAEHICVVDYEEVVSCFEETAGRLVKFIGAPFEEACLKFSESDRVVSTASAMQVRHEIRRSAGAARYVHHLDPLIKALGVR